MTFIEFCRAHGILIDRLPVPGVWKRYRTEDHPNKRNGAVKWLGSIGFAQNHAMDAEVSIWRGQTIGKITYEDRTQDKQRAAALRADGILKNSMMKTHKYLERKGFPDLQWNVYQEKLVVPMYSGNLVGAQLISEDGEKRFLAGQRCSGAEFCFDNSGMDIHCEGFATGLSIREVLRAMKRRYKIHVHFSAGELSKVRSGFVVADNDRAGEDAAMKTGRPYFLPPEGDFNDFHREVGTARAGLALIGSLKP